MTYAAFALYLGVALVFEAVRPPGFVRAGSGPDLLLLLVIYFGLFGRDERIVFPAILVGLFADAFSIEPFGTFAFLYGGLAYALCHVRPYFFHRSPLAHAAVGFAASFAFYLALRLRLSLLLPDAMGAGPGRAILLSAVNGALAPVLFFLFRRTGAFREFTGKAARVSP